MHCKCLYITKSTAVRNGLAKPSPEFLIALRKCVRIDNGRSMIARALDELVPASRFELLTPRV